MKLSPNQHSQITDHIQENWKAPVACPVCKSNDWSISDYVYELREFHGGNFVIGGSSGGIVPLVPVSCNHCGNTVLFNPLIVGIDLSEAENAE